MTYKQKPTIQGVLRGHARGFGFVQADKKYGMEQDVFIPRPMMNGAVDGDRVSVKVVPGRRPEKGPEGQIMEILERAHSTCAGIISERHFDGQLIAYTPLFGKDHPILLKPFSERKLKIGDRIVMRVTDWPKKGHFTKASVSRYMGNIHDPSCDVPASIAEFGLRNRFPQKVVDEAKQFGTRVTSADKQGRKDLSHLECFTIDPDTAKDFDDAVNLKVDSKGNYHLGIHIADVSHYVAPGSLLDEEALKRCNSTYFPGVCVPMLPPALSDNLCSLREKVTRLTVSVLVTLDKDGKVLRHRIVRSFIKSRKRFTYRQAKEVLEGKRQSKHKDSLHLMVKLCKVLKKQRYKRGSLEFCLPELAILVDKQGQPTGTDYVEYDITHQLVEEFMLLANEIVAKHLTKKGKNLSYRVHEEPNDENIADFVNLVNTFGFDLPESPSPQQIQKLFDEVNETSYGRYLATSYIRRMKLACYSPENIGHYGLMLEHYCHFTSPIRRYVDLVVHRTLFDGELSREDLEQACSTCSEQERLSAKAEFNVTMLKKLRLLQKWVSKEPQKQFPAIVTKVQPFGITFDILDLMLEGFIHVSQLENDYFIFDKQGMMLYGEMTGGTFTAGDQITVELFELDLIDMKTEWGCV